MKDKITVSIIEDDKDYRQGLEMIINESSNFKTLYCYASYEEAFPHILVNLPEIVIIDMKLPGKNGVDVISEINLKNPETLCLVCSFYDDNEFVFNALKSGATGYVLKDATPSEIVDSLIELYNGGAPMSPYIAKKVIGAFQQKQIDTTTSALSSREKEIVDLLAAGLTVDEISERFKVSKETVAKHVKNMYIKLHVSNRVDLIKQMKSQSYEIAKFKNEKKREKGFQVSKEHYIEMLRIYATAFEYIIHDLKRENGSINTQLNNISKEINKDYTESSVFNVIQGFADKALKSSTIISSILNVVKPKVLIENNTDFVLSDDTFITKPYEAIEKIKKLYSSYEINVKTSYKDLSFAFPSPLFYLIIEELISNSIRHGNITGEIIVRWQVIGKSFRCEVHDSGEGFANIKSQDFVPLSSLFLPVKNQSNRIGLKIIEQSIESAKGQLFFSNSDLLPGALVLFEFPIAIVPS